MIEFLLRIDLGVGSSLLKLSFSCKNCAVLGMILTARQPKEIKYTTYLVFTVRD